LLASSASALSISPSNASQSGSGNAFYFSASGQPTYNCSSSWSRWQASGGTGGTAEVTLGGCKIVFFGITSNCTTAGMPTGSIQFSKLNYSLVYLDAAKTKFGYKLTPVSGPVAEFTCGPSSYKWTGSVLGQITSPALGVESHTATLRFTATGTSQDYQQVEGAGTSYHLSQSQNGGAAVDLGINTEIGLTSVALVKYLP